MNIHYIPLIFTFFLRNTENFILELFETCSIFLNQNQKVDVEKSFKLKYFF